MKVQALYFSPTKSTEIYVRSVASGIGLETEYFNLTIRTNREHPLVFEKDIVLIGFPLYGMRIPEPVHNYMNLLDGNGNLLIAVCVYGNIETGIANQQIMNWASQHNFHLIGIGNFVAQHTFSSSKVRVGFGRPNKEDLSISREFGTELRNKVETGDYSIPKVKKDLLFPIIEKAPQGGIKRLVSQPKVMLDRCTNCLRCVKQCPVGAIQRSLEIDEARCLRCMACVKNCPANARQNKFKNILIGKIFNLMGSKVNHNQYIL